MADARRRHNLDAGAVIAAWLGGQTLGAGDPYAAGAGPACADQKPVAS
ncbi:MAG: hypothetical protein M5U29_14180 [Anaerolineae bacterium]|nr:hypothetical protein [Anaerolineae bacterium]